MLKKLNYSDGLLDSYGRRIDYLRISVTDRCNFRCTYCMPERMQFLAKKDILTFEEMTSLCVKFINRGIRKIRITGGEPLVRKGIMGFIKGLSLYLGDGQLEEITMTTNGSLLEETSNQLFENGIKRINVSLDSMNKERFFKITRRDNLDQVLKGIYAAKNAGIKIKINTVALKDENIDEIPEIIKWAHSENFDISLIETMPMGEIEEDRFNQYFSLTDMRKILDKHFTFEESNYETAGPSKYFFIEETNGRLGLITPLSNNFCSSCNRIRITATGKLYMCLGQNDNIDFRDIIRTKDVKLFDKAIDIAMRRKPEKHDFLISEKDQKPAVNRHMSVTGG